MIAADGGARAVRAPEAETVRRKQEKPEPQAEKRAVRSVKPVRPGAEPEEKELPINIEGEPREQEEEKDRGGVEHPPLREEAIRQILEEFLA